jgi:RNA recognition motif-containing protein
MGLDNEAQKAIAELNGKSFAGKPLTVSDAIQQHRSIYTNDGYNFG